MTDKKQRTSEFLPLGYSRQEGGKVNLSPIKDIGPKCPKCGEGYIVNVTKHSSWGRPESPATTYCRECGTKFTLGLKAES